MRGVDACKSNQVDQIQLQSSTYVRTYVYVYKDLEMHTPVHVDM